MPSAVKVMRGWVSVSKISAERRCLSRRVLPVSTEAVATARVPLTLPSVDTVPCPLTSRKAPFTLKAHAPGLQPDAGPARVQDPFPGQRPVGQQGPQLRPGHLP